MTINVNEQVGKLFSTYVETFKKDAETSKKQACLNWFSFACETLKTACGDIRSDVALQKIPVLYGLIERATIAPYFNDTWLSMHGLKEIATVKTKKPANALPSFVPIEFVPIEPNAEMLTYMGKDGKAQYLKDIEAKNAEAKQAHEQSEAQRLLQTFEPFVAQTVSQLATVLTLPQMRQLFEAVFASLETEKSDLQNPF